MKLHLHRNGHADPGQELDDGWAPPDTLTIGVVANSRKSVGRGPLAADLDDLRRALADTGHPDVALVEIDRAKQAGKAVRKLTDGGVNRVLVWGGDGTVRRCVHEVVAAKLTDRVPGFSLALLPAGTGNLLATNLGIPDSLETALEIALTGDPRPIDVGEMNGRSFAVMAGTGFDAIMLRDADQSGLKERFGRAGYVWATLRNTDVRPVRTRIEVDGTWWFDGPATCVLIGNVGKLFGGLTAFPDADPTDGRLEIGVVQARRPSDWVKVGVSVVTGRARLSPLVTTTTGSTATIRLDKKRAWEVDGSARPPKKRLSVRCHPAAIRICQPEYRA
jgi:diacylglycerol kinase (ATP)